jgi:hypothetical protein
MSGSDSSFVSGVIRLALDGPFVQNHPVGIGVDANGRIAVGVELSSRTGNTSGVARLNGTGVWTRPLVTMASVRPCRSLRSTPSWCSRTMKSSPLAAAILRGT